MKKKDIVVGNKYFYISGIFIEDCYIVQNDKFLIIQVEGEFEKICYNQEDTIHGTFEDAKKVLINTLTKQLNLVKAYKDRDEN